MYEDARCDKDIRARIGMAKASNEDVRKISVSLSAENVCVVSFTVWMRGLDNQYGDEEEAGCGKDAVL